MSKKEIIDILLMIFIPGIFVVSVFTMTYLIDQKAKEKANKVK